MASPFLCHLPPSPPTFHHLPSSKSSPPNPLLPLSSSLSSSPIFSLQLCKGTPLLHQHCTFITACSPKGSSAVVISDVEAEKSEEKSAEPRRRLIAQNIPWTFTAEEIKSLFEKHGTVLDVELSMYNSSKNRGLAFITMASEEEALMALNNLNSYELNDRVIKVEFSRSLKKKAYQETTVPSSTEFTVFVGNLTWRVRSRDLREFFSTTGKPISAEVIFQSNPRRSAGYGFVSFATKEEAEAAIAAHNDKSLMGRKIRLILRKPQADNFKGKISDDELPFEASKVSNPSEEAPVQTGESLDVE